ncbi:MAG: low molecular weight phosphotyrosine protein phosphatase [Alistipes sp.]|nr:low molecular weight phosphotyrosine protein phosphatase [Alistipes sp.]
MKILFVCLGNICRSPAAEEIMRQTLKGAGLEREVEVDSAGTYGGHRGELPDARMRAAAARRGYRLTHRSRQLCEEDFTRFDRIVVMDDMNYETVHRMAPSRALADKIERMRDRLSPSKFPDRTYIPDPYYEGAEGFELVLDMLEDACVNLLEDIGR